MRLTPLQAAEQLNQGAVVAVPTETVYGLAARFDRPTAVQRIFQLKGRPLNNPLILHLADVSQLGDYVVDWPEGLTALTKAFWPGPLTIVLPIDTLIIPAAVRANLPTAAFRVPAHPVAKEILAMTGPLVMPSANLSGRPSATSYRHVEEDFGVEFPVVDGGSSKHGVESTIVLTQAGEWHLLRLGAISLAQLTEVLGKAPEMSLTRRGVNGTPLCPGQLYRHYAPKTRLYLQLSDIMEGNGSPVPVVGFSDRVYPKYSKCYVLGRSDSPGEVLENLYEILRSLDRDGVAKAWVDMRFPEDGLWKTVRDRLIKAGGL